MKNIFLFFFVLRERDMNCVDDKNVCSACVCLAGLSGLQEEEASTDHCFLPTASPSDRDAN